MSKRKFTIQDTKTRILVCCALVVPVLALHYVHSISLRENETIVKSVYSQQQSIAASMLALTSKLDEHLKTVEIKDDAEREEERDRMLLPFPAGVKYLYINVGTSYDPDPACAMDPEKVPNGMLYDPQVHCLYVEPLFRVHVALRKRGYDNNSTTLIHSAVTNSRRVIFKSFLKCFR